jgi:hypothetical protein
LTVVPFDLARLEVTGPPVAREESVRERTEGAQYAVSVVGSEDRTRYLAYWQGQSMRASPTYATEWVSMSGCSGFPKVLGICTCNCGRRNARIHLRTGSAARFSDIRLHIFTTEQEARIFIKNYQ